MNRAITVTEESIECQVDDTAFLEVMGKSPVNKVLDFLIENDDASWTMKDISEGRNMGYSTLKLLLPKMIESNLILIDREIGKIKFYKINKDNDIVKYVYKIYNVIDEKVKQDFMNS